MGRQYIADRKPQTADRPHRVCLRTTEYGRRATVCERRVLGFAERRATSDERRKNSTQTGLFLSSLFFVVFGLQTASFGESTVSFEAIRDAFLREAFEDVVGWAPTFVNQSEGFPQERTRVRCWWALSLDRLQRRQEALEVLDQLKARLSSDDAFWQELLFWEGEISRRALQMVRARVAYQRLLERFPQSMWMRPTHFGLGLVFLHEQAWPEALSQFQAVLAQGPEDTIALEARFLQGFSLMQLKKFPEAIPLLQALVEQEQDTGVSAQASFYLGEAFSALENFEEASRAYQQAINVDSSSSWHKWALFGLGWSHYLAGKCEESLQVLDDYLREDPDFGAIHRTEAHFAQGSCWVQLKRPEKALELFQRVLEEDPQNSLAVESGLAVVDMYQKRGEWALGIQVLERLLEFPRDTITRSKIQWRVGMMALEQGNAEQARRLFTLAGVVEEPSARQSALNGLGDVEVFLGNLERAQTYYEQVIPILPGSSDAAYATYQLGRLNLQMGAFDRAQALFQRVTAASDAAIADDALLSLALVYLHQEKESLARSHLETLRQRRSGSPLAARAGYYLCLLALEQGNEEQSDIQLCHDVIDQVPDSEEAMEARLLLADLKARSSVFEAMEELRAVYRSSTLSLYQRARVAQRLGDLARRELNYADAITWYEQAAEWHPTRSGEASYFLASCYEEGGDRALALQRYQAIRDPAWRIRGQLAAARLLEREHNIDAAVAIYTSLSKEFIPEAKVVRERLATLLKDNDQ